MKKLILTILFLCILPICFAEMHGKIEAGYLLEFKSIQLTCLLSYDFWQIVIYGGYETLMTCKGRVPLTPFEEAYLMGLRWNMTKNIYLILEHECIHPVLSPSDAPLIKGRFGGATKIKIGYKW